MTEVAIFEYPQIVALSALFAILLIPARGYGLSIRKTWLNARFLLFYNFRYVLLYILGVDNFV